MNEAERLMRKIFGVKGDGVDAFKGAQAGQRDAFAHFHPDVRNSLFGPSGTKETLVGKDAMIAFVQRCAAALAAHEDKILGISSIDEHCAFVHASAYRKSAATGEEIRYEWAMLYRVDNGLITYGADMLDPDAQAFWGRVLGTAQ